LLSSQEPLIKVEDDQPTKKLKGDDGKSSSESSVFATFIREYANLNSNPNYRSKVIDVPLLFACKLLDYSNRGYFTLYNLETIIGSLGLPISRYQIRALTSMVVGDSSRVYYRCLTDGKPELKDDENKDTAANKNAQRTSSKRPLELPVIQWPLELNGNPLSLIDDEEYLEELVRGGDAILDEDEVSRLQKMPSLVLCGMSANGEGETSDSSIAENFIKQLRRMENECLRLEEKVKNQETALVSLRKENSEIPKLKAKLSKSMSMTDVYRDRCHDRKSTLASALHKLESQACVLETSTQSIRSLARRLKRDLQANDSSQRSESRTSSVAPSSKSRLPSLDSSLQRSVPAGKETVSQTPLVEHCVPENESAEQGMKIDDADKTSVEIVTIDATEKEGEDSIPPPLDVVGVGESEAVNANDFNDINSDDSLESVP